MVYVPKISRSKVRTEIIPHLCARLSKVIDTQTPEIPLSLSLLIHPDPDVGDVGVPYHAE